MNKELLLRIANAILESPLKFHMDAWVDSPGLYSVGYKERELNLRDVLGFCRSTCCIGGWACALSDEILNINTIQQRATELLNLSREEAVRLFYVSHWPKEFKEKFFGSTPERKAEVARQRITHFIDTEGKE